MSRVISILLFVSIAFNTKLSDSPPLFLSNIIVSVVCFLMMCSIVRFGTKSNNAGFIAKLVGSISLVSLIAVMSLGNSSVSIVFPKLLLCVLVYNCFSRYLQTFNKDLNVILFGIVFGVALSPLWQSELSDFAAISITNRLQADNLGNFNTYSYLLAVSILTAFFLLTTTKSLLLSSSLIAAQVTMLFFLLFTLSRGGLFALLVGVGTHVVLSRDRKFSVLAGILFALSILMLGLIEYDLENVFSQRYFGTSGTDSFDSGRFDIYRDLFENFLNSGVGIIWGLGLGAVDLTTVHGEKNISSHSTYMDVLYSFGLIGLLIFINLLYSFYSLIKEMPDSPRKNLCASLFSQAIFAFFYDSYWGATQVGWILPCIFGVVWACAKMSTEKTLKPVYKF